jgi:hypothetical protein
MNADPHATQTASPAQVASPTQAVSPTQDTAAAEPQPPRRRFIDYLGLYARGFAMGASDIVPGVSGGTMALILAQP